MGIGMGYSTKKELVVMVLLVGGNSKERQEGVGMLPLSFVASPGVRVTAGAGYC